jgi:hypothetical protein
MVTGYPTPLATWAEPDLSPQTRGRAGSIATVDGSWRYSRPRTPWSIVTVAVIGSAALHVVLLFGALLLPKKAAPIARVERAPVIRLAIPELKELEEPETTATDETAPPVDLSIPVPMQADLPTLPAPSDFVQPLNFASLLEQPDLSQAN